jgi:glucosamine-6-phosphate deaminase
MAAMRIEIVAGEEALAVRAADIVCDAVRAQPTSALGLPTGGTPIATYAELSRRAAEERAGFSRATAFAVDEFLGVATMTRGTNSAFFRDHLRVRLRALHVPDASPVDADAHIAAFADAIREAGGIDLCVRGIGVNGHIAFNEPGSGRASRARVVELARPSREAHAAAFGSLDAVPKRGLTLGIADLLESRAILVLASGAAKAVIVARPIEGPQSADVPASWLQSHSDVTWLLDESAATGLTRG